MTEHYYEIIANPPKDSKSGYPLANGILRSDSPVELLDGDYVLRKISVKELRERDGARAKLEKFFGERILRRLK